MMVVMVLGQHEFIRIRDNLQSVKLENSMEGIGFADKHSAVSTQHSAKNSVSAKY
jgi:hypothetical protein